MPKKKTLLAFVLIAVMIFSISMVAFADGPIHIGTIATTDDLQAAREDSLGALSFGIAPDQYFPFIYNGTCPYAWEELDTSDCVVGRLYVHHRTEDIIIEITESQVTSCTETQDGLYYVTADRCIVATDFSGANHTILYQSPAQSLKDLDTYWDILYFIEDDTRVVLLDTETNAVETVLTYDNIQWVDLYTPTQLVCETTVDDFIHMDLSTGQITGLGSMADVNYCMAPYVTPDTTESDVSLNTLPAGFVNNISFPLSEYPANEGYSLTQVLNPTPKAYFSKCSGSGHVCSWSNSSCARSESTCDHDKDTPENVRNCAEYAGAGMCQGFALYAHDVYMHIENWSRNPNAWAEGDMHATGYTFNTDSAVRSFYSGLEKGTYIRYCSEDDPTPDNGAHSVVFDRMDANGVWVYECNQDWHCGVFYQYYPFSKIQQWYTSVLFSIKHSFPNRPNVLSTITHTLNCLNCTGSLRQSHTAVAIYRSQDDTYHRVSFSCCDGYALQKHIILSGAVDRCKRCTWIE